MVFKNKLLLGALLLCFIYSCNDDPSINTDQGLLGSWQVTAIHNSSPSGPTIGPGPEEEITITFMSDGTFTGTTSVNTFNGRYVIEIPTLTLLEFTTTEVLDTAFGTAFYGAIANAIVPNETFARFEYVQDGNRVTLYNREIK